MQATCWVTVFTKNSPGSGKDLRRYRLTKGPRIFVFNQGVNIYGQKQMNRLAVTATAGLLDQEVACVWPDLGSLGGRTFTPAPQTSAFRQGCLGSDSHGNAHSSKVSSMVVHHGNFRKYGRTGGSRSLGSHPRRMYLAPGPFHPPTSWPPQSSASPPTHGSGADSLG